MGEKLHNAKSQAAVHFKETCFIKSIIIIWSHRRSNDQPHTQRHARCQNNVETHAQNNPALIQIEPVDYVLQGFCTARDVGLI